jgi:hypothetical protein
MELTLSQHIDGTAFLAGGGRLPEGRKVELKKAAKHQRKIRPFPSYFTFTF